jgi:hypothetical protein
MEWIGRLRLSRLERLRLIMAGVMSRKIMDSGKIVKDEAAAIAEKKTEVAEMKDSIMATEKEG